MTLCHYRRAMLRFFAVVKVSTGFHSPNARPQHVASHTPSLAQRWRLQLSIFRRSKSAKVKRAQTRARQIRVGFWELSVQMSVCKRSWQRARVKSVLRESFASETAVICCLFMKMLWKRVAKCVVFRRLTNFVRCYCYVLLLLLLTRWCCTKCCVLL